MGEALLKVLLVDDEPFILQGLKILIDWEQEGFEVVKTAANGEEALEYLRGEQVDLIIADIKYRSSQDWNFWRKSAGKRFPMHIL